MDWDSVRTLLVIVMYNQSKEVCRQLYVVIKPQYIYLIVLVYNSIS